jgi:two-component system, OmpR family, alkaline phosphatase synthesis response regulator PhoP
MRTKLILLVDDEEHIVQLARMYLEREGFQIQSAGNGMQAMDAILNLHPSLVVLDIMLPGIDGLEVCRRLRGMGNNTPIIMLTARDEDIDKILGLELGADDYMTKPFNPRELVARVKTILRRVETPPGSSNPVIILGNTQIIPEKREVICQDEIISLRTQEFEVLHILAQNVGVVLSREQLLSKAWGFEYAGQTRTVDVHIAQLRRKLARSSIRIETITGIGYKLVA